MSNSAQLSVAGASAANSNSDVKEKAEESPKVKEAAPGGKESVASPLEVKIIRQVEYYFGDRNLPRDKFLQCAAAENEDGWVPVATLLTFNRLKCLSSDPDEIVRALRKSASSILEVNSEGNAVRRCPDNPPPDIFSAEQRQKMKEKTIYVTSSSAKTSQLDCDVMFKVEVRHRKAIPSKFLDDVYRCQLVLADNHPTVQVCPLVCNYIIPPLPFEQFTSPTSRALPPDKFSLPLFEDVGSKDSACDQAKLASEKSKSLSCGDCPSTLKLSGSQCSEAKSLDGCSSDIKSSDECSSASKPFNKYRSVIKTSNNLLSPVCSDFHPKSAPVSEDPVSDEDLIDVVEVSSSCSSLSVTPPPMTIVTSSESSPAIDNPSSQPDTPTLSSKMSMGTLLCATLPEILPISSVPEDVLSCPASDMSEPLLSPNLPQSGRSASQSSDGESMLPPPPPLIKMSDVPSPSPGVLVPLPKSPRVLAVQPKRPELAMVTHWKNSKVMQTSSGKNSLQEDGVKVPIRARHSVPCACPAILPPVLGGDFMNPPCQYCLLGPCVMVRPPPLLWGNAGLVQGNNSFKRHYLYNQLYGVLRELKVWLHPHYLMQKQLTCGLESREIMPNCIVHEVRLRFPNSLGVSYMDSSNCYIA